MVDLYIFIIMPIFIAALMYLFMNFTNIKKIAVLLEAVLMAAAVVNFWFIKQHGTVVQNIGGWEDYIGIALRADLLSAVMLMLTICLFLSMLVFNYSRPYVDKLFVLLILILQALISGIFLSNDLFNIYVLIEVSTIVVAILIMFKKDSRSIYDGMVYLLINIVAATFLLFGIGYLYKIFGVLDIYGIQERMKLIENPGTVIIPYALIITAVSLKSALMPLFSWLPKAHGTPSAPSVVSAILSGLYVKSGLYLFIRMQEMFSGVIDTSEFFLVMGLLTGVIGFLLALSQTDIKLILAYHTISQIGLIMIGLNYPSKYSYWGAIYHIINHAFFKSVLFLTAGIIIEEYGTRNIWNIKGVFKKMPVVAGAAILSILGITGAPFFNGSISKYFIQSGMKDGIYEYGLLLINLGTIISFVKYSTIFFGNKEGERAKIDGYRLFVISILGVMCFAGGVYGQGFIELLFNQAFTIDLASYLQKAAVYIGSLIIGFIIYRKIIVKSKFLYRIKQIELGFNDICLSMIIFLSTITLYLIIYNL